jgi:hypothetical protein
MVPTNGQPKSYDTDGCFLEYVPDFTWAGAVTGANYLRLSLLDNQSPSQDNVFEVQIYGQGVAQEPPGGASCSNCAMNRPAEEAGNAALLGTTAIVVAGAFRRVRRKR